MVEIHEHHTPRICCFLVLILPIMVVVPLLFAGIPNYQIAHTTADRDGDGMRSYTTVKAFETKSSTQSLLFHPTISHLFGNYSRDFCKNPYEWVCEHGIEDKPITEMIQDNDDRIIRKVIIEEMSQTNFVKSCKKFHQMEQRVRYSLLSNHPRLQFIWNVINKEEGDHSRNDFLDSLNKIKSSRSNTDVFNSVDLLNVVTLLHATGVREPFHLIRTTDESFALTQPSRLYNTGSESSLEFIQIYLERALKGFQLDERLVGDQTSDNSLIQATSKQIHRDYEEISSVIFYPSDLGRFMTIDSINKQIGVKINGFFSEQDFGNLDNTIIFTNIGLIQTFVRTIPLYSKQQWRNYLFFATIKSLLLQSRMLYHTNEEICNIQIAEYFPITMCRKFKKLSEYSEDVEILKKYMVDGFTERILTENIFGFPPNVQTELSNRLKSAKMFINACTTPGNNRTLTLMERRYLNNVNWTNLTRFSSGSSDYLDILFNMIGDPDFQQHRNKIYDSINGEIVQNYLMSWSAHYSDTLNAFIIGPGMLNFPAKHSKFGGCHYHALIDHRLFHEMMHFLIHHIRSIGPNAHTKQWNDFIEDVRRRYSTGSPSQISDDLWEENIADNGGKYISYNTWNSKFASTDDDRKCFIVSYLRSWCVGDVKNQGDPDPDHASNKRRAVYPLYMIRNTFTTLFNCTHSSLI